MKTAERDREEALDRLAMLAVIISAKRLCRERLSGACGLQSKLQNHGAHRACAAVGAPYSGGNFLNPAVLGQVAVGGEARDQQKESSRQEHAASYEPIGAQFARQQNAVDRQRMPAAKAQRVVVDVRGNDDQLAGVRHKYQEEQTQRGVAAKHGKIDQADLARV